MLAFIPTRLLQRHQEEALRLERRRVKFPDNKTRDVETYRVTWAWFDNLANYEFAPDRDGLLRLALACAREEEIDIGDALLRVVDHVVAETEACGGDITDDRFVGELALAQVAGWYRWGCN